MHDFFTSFVTLAGGILVFALTQYWLKLVLEPISRVRRTLADISSTALFHQAAICNGRSDEALATEFRKLSANLRAAVYEVRHYRVVAKMCGVPSEANALAGCHQLNLLSYHTRPEGQYGHSADWWATENSRTLIKLSDLLGIKTRYSD